jgi:hypothetical protein
MIRRLGGEGNGLQTPPGLAAPSTEARDHAWRHGPSPLPGPGPGRGIRRDVRVLKTAVAKPARPRRRARRLEHRVTSATFPQLVDQEQRDSADYGERSVFGWEPPPARTGSR